MVKTRKSWIGRYLCQKVISKNALHGGIQSDALRFGDFLGAIFLLFAYIPWKILGDGLTKRNHEVSWMVDLSKFPFRVTTSSRACPYQSGILRRILIAGFARPCKDADFFIRSLCL